MPADFLTIPPTTPANGLTGYYASAEIGVWKHKYDASEVFINGLSDDLTLPHEEDCELVPFDLADERRLGIRPAAPSETWSDEEKPTTKLGNVRKFDLEEP